MKVYIIGYMGSGKTRLGAELADALGYGYTDLDQSFEEKYSISVTDFFEKYGEETFRRLERQILLQTAHEDNMVIATGGGTPCFFENMDFISDNGISVYLQQPVDVLLKRLIHPRQKRPLLKGLSPLESEAFIRDHLAEREQIYRKADIITDGAGIESLAIRIRELSSQ